MDASVKKRNKLMEVLEMELIEVGEKKKKVVDIEIKLKDVKKKISKLKFIGTEELKLTKKNKELELKLNTLQSHGPAPVAAVSLNSDAEMKISTLQAK